jgi:hypothetical protein
MDILERCFALTATAMFLSLIGFGLFEFALAQVGNPQSPKIRAAAMQGGDR